MVEELDLMGAQEMADPAVSAKRLLAGERIAYYPHFDPPFYIASRHADVADILRQPEVFLSGHGQ